MPELHNVEVQVIEEREKSWKLESKETGKQDFFPKGGEHGITFCRRNTKTGQAVAEIPVWMLDAKGW